MLSDFSVKKTPHALLLGEFLQQLQVSQTLTIQSAHPFDNLASTQVESIPDAEYLHVTSDEASQMNEQDKILLYSGDGGKGLVFMGELSSIFSESVCWRFIASPIYMYVVLMYLASCFYNYNEKRNFTIIFILFSIQDKKPDTAKKIQGASILAIWWSAVLAGTTETRTGRIFHMHACMLRATLS